MTPRLSPEELLLTELAGFHRNPLGFVLWAFPWGEPGTALENRSGPEAWQRKVLIELGENLDWERAVRQAICSGNGVGKSALVSWIILWGMSTFPDTKLVITANTETQLKTKTWAELGKWFQLFIANQFFEITATALFSRDPAHKLTWRADMVPWSERNAVAFQGLHNQGKRLGVIFDEASGIDDLIWEAADGCMTDANTERFWLVCGNPNEPEGRFKECFDDGKFANQWMSHRVDARSVSFTDKAEHASWIASWGLDSDFVRVRILGQFPRFALNEFISAAIVREAMEREVTISLDDPLILGVDVARFGKNVSVIYPRKGRDARTIPRRRFRNISTMQLALEVVKAVKELDADAVFIDGTGVGGGVVDRVRQLGVDCYEINFGGRATRSATDGTHYADKRTEIWGTLREALQGIALPNDKELLDQLTAPLYGYVEKTGAMKLEAKDSMESRGVESPDDGDALALTYSYPIAIKSRRYAAPAAEGIDYDPYRENAA